MGAYADSVLADAPLLYYRFEDSVSNLGSLSVTNTSSVNYGAGKSGRCFVGNGSSTHVTVATTNPYFNDNTWSIESWVKMDTTVANDYNTITRRNSGSHYMLDRVRGTNITNPGRYEVFYQNGFGSASLLSPASVCDGNWHQVVISGAGAYLYMYIDGAYTNVQATIPGSGAALAITGDQYIGKTEGNNEYFLGSLDEVAIYGAQLPLARITAHYNAMAVDAAKPPFKGWGIPAR